MINKNFLLLPVILYPNEDWDYNLKKYKIIKKYEDDLSRISIKHIPTKLI